LQRWGLNGSCTWGMIDNLTYNYGASGYNTKNKLNSVTDGSDLTKGFKTISNGSAYSYDADGNMTADPNKGITNIVYNHMNLPTTITFTGGNAINFMYDAVGNKLRKTVTGTAPYVQDYVGGIEYRGGVLEAIYHAEGRITTISGALKYEYALKDHLGNTRIMFSDKNADGLITLAATSQETSEVTQENHYYPFGLNMESVWMNTPSVLDNKYQYNGKELNDDYGLGLMDYDFRFYDPTIGRFTTFDPLAEIYDNQTPYAYAANNPINFIDFMGLGPADGNPSYDPDKDKSIHTEAVVITATRLPKGMSGMASFLGNSGLIDAFDRSGKVTAGVSNAIISNTLLNAPGTRVDPNEAFKNEEDAKAFAEGQMIGDGISVILGGLEFIGGAVGVGTEIAAAGPSGGMSLGGVVYSAGRVVHGGYMGLGAMNNLLNPTVVKAKGKKARDSSKAEPHGDNGRALEKAQPRLNELREKLKNSSGNDAKKIKQTIKNIIRDAHIKDKGINDNNNGIRK
jgi:RHS repeat-associated protein